MPTEQELKTQRRIKLWEELISFAELFETEEEQYEEDLCLTK